MGSKSATDQIAGGEDAIAGEIARQHDDHVGGSGRFGAHQVSAKSGQPKVRRDYEQENQQHRVNQPAERMAPFASERSGYLSSEEVF